MRPRTIGRVIAVLSRAASTASREQAHKTATCISKSTRLRVRERLNSNGTIRSR
jgi:hypothetical protein